MLVRLFSICLLFVGSVFSRDLIREQVDIYKTIMKAQGYDSLNVTSLTKLFSMHDDDSFCSPACERYLKSILKESDWEFFYTLISTIYAGQISEDPFMPQEIHLALTPSPTAMKVMWASMENLESPFCEYIPATSNDWSAAKSVVASNYTYRVTQKWWPIFTGVLYETDMVNLTPATKYRYRVGGWDTANSTTRYSAEFEFTAAPVSDSPNRATKVAFIADHGTFELLGFGVIRKMVELQPELNFELVMVGGDLSYAGLSSAMPALNIDKEDEFEHIWDLLLIQNQPVAATVPWMVATGNHERFYNWSAFTNRFHMPASPGSEGNFWYSYDFGNSHWIGISSEHSLDPGSPQLTFLEQDLIAATANRGTVPWIMVVLHKPLYSSDDGAPDGFADKLEPLCIKYDVDLTLTGHMHAYERVHPVEKGAVTVYPTKGRTAEDKRMDVYHSTGKGPVHIVQGNSGAMQFEKWQQPAPAWSAVRMANGYVVPNRTKEELTVVAPSIDLPFNYTNTFGFGVLNFINSTHLHYSSIPITGSNGADEFWIVKRV